MTDIPLVPEPEPRTVLSQDLRPGMVIRQRDHNVEILREQEPDTGNPFGLPWFKHWARIVESGREGWIRFGPDATITLVD